jgi:SAM-dependent methyltransferase
VGTGRLAIPLVESGLDVWGVDASAAMLDRLATKPGGERVVAIEGDLASMALPGSAPTFGLAFAAFNTFCMLADEGAQRSCLEHVAGAVAPDGRLILEVFVPPLVFAPGGVVEVADIASDRLLLRAFRRASDDDTFEGHHVEITEAGGVRLRPWRIRAPQPAALDALAAAAGWRLIDRAAGWTGEPFTNTSRRHVSTYELARGRSGTSPGTDPSAAGPPAAQRAP